MKYICICVSLSTLAVIRVIAADVPNLNRNPLPGLDHAERSPISSFFVAPTRIVWQSEAGVNNASALIAPHAGQAVLKEPQPPCELASSTAAPAGVLLDFGRELHGGIELFTTLMPAAEKLRQVRVRFGESASEAMADLGGSHNAGNDHAIRDQVVSLPWLGKRFVGPTGFRFVRIDSVDTSLSLQLSQVRAVLQIRELRQKSRTTGEPGVGRLVPGAVGRLLFAGVALWVTFKFTDADKYWLTGALVVSYTAPLLVQLQQLIFPKK